MVLRIVWKDLEILANEALKCYKPNSMGGLGQSLEDQNADKHTDGKDQAQLVSDGSKYSIVSWIQAYMYYTLE